MLVYSNGMGMPNDVNIYYESDNGRQQWLLGTVWSTKVFPNLNALLDSMVRNGIESRESVSKIKAIIENRMIANADECLTWSPVGTSEDTLSRVLADATVLHAEPLNYPVTDGVQLVIEDRTGKKRLLQIEVAEGLVFDAEHFNGVPLTIKMSSPIPSIDE